MKKKFAHLLIGGCFDPAAHKACFSNASMETHVFTVKDVDEAKACVLKCLDEGFGAIDLCGGFGPDLTRELIELTKGKIAFGYVVRFPEQEAQYMDFFSDFGS